MHKTTTVLTVADAFLASPTERFWGYELSKTTGIRTGTLYPILTRFLNAGWITDGWEDTDEKTGERRPPRRYYTLSDAGAQALLSLTTQAKAEARARRSRRRLIPGEIS